MKGWVEKSRQTLDMQGHTAGLSALDPCRKMAKGEEILVHHQPWEYLSLCKKTLKYNG